MDEINKKLDELLLWVKMSRGGKNIQNAGEVTDSIFNSGHIRVNNYINFAKTSPKEIEIKAIVNSSLYYYLLIVATLALFFVYGYTINYLFRPGINTVLFFAIVGAGLSEVALVDWVEKILWKISSKNITYVNKTLKIKGKVYKFYEDIWDIEYKSSLFTPGAILTIYMVDPYEKIPKYEKIKFENTAKAKYVYDSFHTGKLIKKMSTKPSTDKN